ncbi:3'-5' exonuclease [Aquiflexum sp. TKW24L]|uniref:3'-5' exonuclease n=1 Tax=Aquiflexum sp. TKW24L TaxID=2942212 RepID=UPI0020C18981|nr:3'-5' exonuclease [Aquiflexum sp. TKW24L]MCL6258532.1 3'-5' exonuclease [Aquiflexum sp. TKW24L]
MGWVDFLLGKKIPKSTFVVDYEFGFEKKIPSLRTIPQLSFVVLDTETTGFNPKIDHILSFGAIKLKGYSLKVDTSMERYLDAPIQNRESVKVHEILYSIETSPLKDFGRDFLTYVGADIIVGHHIGFDLTMLEKTLRPFGFKEFLNPVIDTKYLAMRLEKGPHYDTDTAKAEEYSLDAVCERYGIELTDRHTAAGDAFVTAQLLMKLLKIAETKGIKDFGGLMR